MKKHHIWRNTAAVAASLTASATLMSAELTEEESLEYILLFVTAPLFTVLRIAFFITIFLFIWGFITDKMADHPKIFTLVTGILNLPYFIYLGAIGFMIYHMDKGNGEAWKLVGSLTFNGTFYTGSFLSVAAFIYCIITWRRVKRSIVNYK